MFKPTNDVSEQCGSFLYQTAQIVTIGSANVKTNKKLPTAAIKILSRRFMTDIQIGFDLVQQTLFPHI